MATFRERLELYPHGQWHVGARFVFEHEWEPEEKHRCRRHSSSSSSSSASSHQEGEKRICHFQDFPKALGTILDTLKVRDFRLQLGRGTWDDDVWGRDPDGGIATGAELWARFAADGATEAWKGLTEALGGLYCASLGMMDESRTVRPTLSDIYTDGWETSGNHGADDRSSTVLLRGFLPREAVCTENLTPLVKSLPCRNHAGLGALLHPTRIFSAAFYGLTVSARAEWDGDTPTRLILSQTVHAVWFKLPSELEEIYSSPRGWDLTSFLIPSSAQSASSKPVPGVSILDRCWHSDRLEVRVHGHPVAWGSPPHVVKSLTLDDGDEPLRLREGVGGRLLPPISTRDLLGHLSMDHYLSGKGGIEGWSVSVMRNAGPVERKVAYSQAIPGIMEPLFSTSQLTVGSQQIPLIVSGKRGSSEEEREGKSAAMHISLSSSCASGGHGPWLLELETTIPPESSVTFAFKFLKRFILSSEFPPDASRGLDVPAPSMLWHDSSNWESESFTYIYGTGPLLDPPLPDFSMPFNVITLSCTAIAFFIGTLANMLIRKSDWKSLRSSSHAEEQQGWKARVREKLSKLAAKLGISKNEAATVDSDKGKAKTE